MSNTLDNIFGYNKIKSKEQTDIANIKSKEQTDIANIKSGVSQLKTKYKSIRADSTKDFDEIRDEIIELKNGNYKLLKDLMLMMEGNIQPSVLKSYSDIIKSTVDLNKFILDIDDKRKSNIEDNIYNELAELDEENETPADKTNVFKLSSSELFGSMMDDVKDIMLNKLKNNNNDIMEAEEVEVIDDN